VRLAVFDMDGVLIDSYSSWVLVHRHFGTNNEDSLRAFLRGDIDDFEFIRRDVERWSQARGSVPLAEVRRVLDTAPLVPGAIETLLELKGNGFETAIVSGGLRYLAERIGRMGKVDHVYANDVEVDEDGCLTGGGFVNVPLKDKGSVVSSIQGKMGIPPEETVAVGDTAVDISMFRQARLSIAFNPGDEVVERAASQVVRARDLRAILPIILDGIDERPPHRQNLYRRRR
jgi:phosphoserine phosphatase